MYNIWIICKRELNGYFNTPIAYVFLTIFLISEWLMTFYLGDFFDRGQADLAPFFNAQPWLLGVFLPAVAMRVWAEERRSGTIELLLTLPINALQAILGKFLAGYVFTMLALVMTFPLWLAVNYLGNPDNGIIFAGYLATMLLAGAYLAIGLCMSALTKSQVIAFVLTVLSCCMLNALGFIPGLSFLSNFEMLSRGLLDLRSVIYFASLMIFCLFANAVIIEIKRAD